MPLESLLGDSFDNRILGIQEEPPIEFEDLDSLAWGTYKRWESESQGHLLTVDVQDDAHAKLLARGSWLGRTKIIENNTFQESLDANKL